IIELVSSREGDEEIYRALQKRFPDIKPFLSLFRASLPALEKQKKEMQTQTAALIADMKKVDGYVEIGTTGRYYEGVRRCVKVKGKTYILNTSGPSYNPGDMAERGHLLKIGKFISMGDYDAVAASDIAPG